jgi:hypothetical protein
MAALAEKWRPWRGVAAHLLWNYYRVIKLRDGAPVATKMQSRKIKLNNRGGRRDG